MFPDNFGRSGHYDDHGNWKRTKFCFMSCGTRCDCSPPGGLYYSVVHDKRVKEAEPDIHKKTQPPGK